MAIATAEPITEEQIAEQKKTVEVVFSGSLAEGLVAGGAVILTIIGLIGGYPQLLLSIAVIALGAALLFEGAAISLRLYNLMSDVTQNRANVAEIGIGTTAETVAGIFATVLGILAVLQVNPAVLIPAAIIVIGGCLILGAGANARLNALRITRTEQQPAVGEVTRQIVLAATGVQVLVGIGAITLGVMAIIGIEPMVLSLVAIMAMSLSILFSGGALSSRMLSLFRP